MAYKLQNIEFQRTQDRSIIYQQAGSGFVKLTEKDPIMVILEEKIKTEYPVAYTALDKEYSKSRADVRKHRHDIVCAFLSCNCGGSDEKMDIDAFDRFNFEAANCPSLFCKYRGIVCNPKFNLKLTKRQAEIMKMWILCRKARLSNKDTVNAIASTLNISPETVLTTKRDAFKHLKVESIDEFMNEVDGRL